MTFTPEFWESFDYGDDVGSISHLTAKGWTSSSGSVSLQPAGRRDTNGLLVGSGTSGAGSICCPALTSGDTKIAGFSLWLNHATLAASTICLFRTSGTNQIEIRKKADGAIEVTRNATIIATSAAGLLVALNTYHFCVKVHLHDTTGRVIVLLNGNSTPVIDFTGDTRNIAGGINQFWPAHNGVGYFDDVYVGSSDTTTQGDMPGDLKCSYLQPIGPGNSSDWEAIGGSTSTLPTNLAITPTSGTVTVTSLNATNPSNINNGTDATIVFSGAGWVRITWSVAQTVNRIVIREHSNIASAQINLSNGVVVPYRTGGSPEAVEYNFSTASLTWIELAVNDAGDVYEMLAYNITDNAGWKATDEQTVVVPTATPDTHTYVRSSTVGDHDTYELANLEGTVDSVLGVAEVYYVQKDDAGAKTFRGVARSDGVDYESADHSPSTSTYGYFINRRLVDPDTSAAWTGAAVNALEIGPKVQA